MKAILIALLVLTLGASGVFAAGPLGDDASTDRTLPLETSSLVSTTTDTGEDVPGPCDEPEHATDPRCAGATSAPAATTTTTETRGRDDAREPGEDVRGPCDEAEHATDPRCTGGAAGAGTEDRRGSNSGPSGSDDSGSGSSGHGGSDDSRSGSNEGSG